MILLVVAARFDLHIAQVVGGHFYYKAISVCLMINVMRVVLYVGTKILKMISRRLREQWSAHNVDLALLDYIMNAKLVFSLVVSAI